MVNKKLLTGNEAVARGFYEGGGLVASSYPGSPTVEILDAVSKYEEIYSEFSINEKVALELAIGSSFYGARSMVSMKHVGVNVAADPLMTFTQTPTNGGFVLVSGDDPGMASSQNEQDNRIFAKFANMPILYPGSSQEAKDYVKFGLDISEKFQSPVLLDITSRVCHSRSLVEFNDRVEHKPSGFDKDVEKYTMLPPHTFKVQFSMKERLKNLENYISNSNINSLEEKDSDTLIVASGLMYYNLKELDLPFSIYKLGLVYPLSRDTFSDLNKRYKNIIVVEEMMPFIENELKLMGLNPIGKELFSFTGELNTEDIYNGLIKGGFLKGQAIEIVKDDVVSRPPMFCSGCPHRPVFDVLKKLKLTVMGDIGCYSMSVLPAFKASHTMISMGATIGITKGMNKAMRMENNQEPIVSVIGDGTFFHSGMTGFANLLHNTAEDDNMTFLILNNSTTGMTGGQSNGSSGLYNKVDDMQIPIKSLLETMGFDNVKEVDQFDYKNLKSTIEEETNKKGISIIITTRPCALRYKIKEKAFTVDPQICIGCRSCVKTNCPPIKMIKYEGIDKLKSSIDPDSCVGCSVCSQVCPVGAIKQLD